MDIELCLKQKMFKQSQTIEKQQKRGFPVQGSLRHQRVIHVRATAEQLHGAEQGQGLGGGPSKLHTTHQVLDVQQPVSGTVHADLVFFGSLRHGRAGHRPKTSDDFFYTKSQQ